MITLFCIRPKGFNIGNEVIFMGLKHFIYRQFGNLVNLITLPATSRYESNAKAGLTAKTIYDINQYGDGVIVGGGNLYENGELEVDPNALKALEVPLMLFSLSRGRVYNRDLNLVDRTDAMSDVLIKQLNKKASISLARDKATMSYLKRLGSNSTILGGCPTIFLDRFLSWNEKKRESEGVLISIRNPALMNIPPAKQARVYHDVPQIIDMLRERGHKNIRLLCHDHRDIPFAVTFEDIEYIYTEDVQAYLSLLRKCKLNISYRLHATLPCLSFAIPSIQINYDERANSMMDTLGLGDYGIDMCKGDNVVGAIQEKYEKIGSLMNILERVRPIWDELFLTLGDAFKELSDEISERKK